MRPYLLTFFLLAVRASTFCQIQQISLTDGSILHGKIEGVAADSLVKIRLSDSTLIEIPQALIWRVSKNRKQFQILSGSAKVLSRGKYASVGVHTLAAKTIENRFEESATRWGMGFHFSMGFQFSPSLAVGGGIGLDMPDEFYTPVFAEMRGIFVRNTMPFKQIQPKQKHYLRWMGGCFELQPDTTTSILPVKMVRKKQRIALCYSLQLGAYFSWSEVFSGKDFVSVRPGLVLYPAVGFAFPAASGTTFQVDFGYKFQRHSISIFFPSSTTRIIETYYLNSFAMKAGWTF